MVDILDLPIVAAHYGENPPTNARADVNNDNIVNILDLVSIAKLMKRKTDVP